MRAVLAHGARDFRVCDVPSPRTGSGAVVAVEATGVCAADRMIWRGDGPWGDALAFPFVPGHELLGRITAIDDVTGQRWGVGVGDRVAAEVMVPCDACRWCAAGRAQLCRSGRHLGSSLPGGFAEAFALPPNARVHRVPAALSTQQGALIEPTACAVHALRRADLRAGDVLAVAGIGAIGSCAIGAAIGRVARLVAVASSPARAALALALGADAAVDVSAGDALDQLDHATGGAGVDAYVELSGAPESVRLGLDALVPGGRLVVYGVYRRPVSLDLNVIGEFKELDVRGGHLAPGAFPEAIDLLVSGAVDAAGIVTHTHPLEEVEAALEPDATRLKAVLIPGAAV